jgi:hypothetical protein
MLRIRDNFEVISGIEFMAAPELAGKERQETARSVLSHVRCNTFVALQIMLHSPEEQSK